MKIIKNIIFLSIYINALAFGIHTPDNIYYKEFKALKKAPFYQTLFDRRSKDLFVSFLVKLKITKNSTYFLIGFDTRYSNKIRLLFQQL